MKVGALILGLAHVVGIRNEKGPAYQVVVKEGSCEVRSYASYVVARTTVSGGFEESQNRAFGILAGYIFGKNKGRREIAMTAPVLQERGAHGEAMAMTAPVIQEGRDGASTMAFVMPSGYTVDTLPEPLDDRVSFAEVPARTVAAIRFSGRMDAGLVARKTEELRRWLARDGRYRVVSEPRRAAYDPPFTLPLLRRNEIHIDVKEAC